MADKKISALTAASTPLAGTEVLPIVQSGATVKVAVSDLTAGRAMAASSLTTATVQATNSGGLALKNSGGTTQMLLGGGGGDNITLSVATNITPANAAVAISPTGTGTVTLNPATASTINNMSIGATTALSGRFTNVTTTTGSFVVGTAGQGVDFSITSHPAGMTSELLADYEEGTWTPTIIAAGGSGSPTYSSNIGIYTKIGNTVVATAFIGFTKNTLSGGVLQSGGFPFTTTINYYPQAACFLNIGSLIINPICQVGANSTALDVLKSNAVTGAIESTTIADLGAGSLELRYTITYQV
jgi:hypothetical protein